MADRFAVFKASAAYFDGAFVDRDGTGPAALRTGLAVAELGSLLAGGRFHGTGKEALSGSEGHLFHVSEVNVESRPLLAEGTAGDDFAPRLSELGDGLKILRGEFPGAHGTAFLGVRKNVLVEFPPGYRIAPHWLAKCVLHSYPDHSLDCY